MSALAWPLVALVLGALAFAWCWRWADTRARMARLMAEHEASLKKLTTDHLLSQTAREAGLEKLEARLRALELYRGEHERIHASY